MSEEDMVKAVQAALDDHGIDDKVQEVGHFNPRGMTGGLFAGGMAASEAGSVLGGVGEAVGLAAGSLGGMEAASMANGLPRNMLIGASDSTVYGFKMASGGRTKEPHQLLFQVPRAGLEVKVHQRVNVRVLELIDRESGSKIELEGNRLPITHTKDVIEFLEAK
jgi:hypothetical protein